MTEKIIEEEVDDSGFYAGKMLLYLRLCQLRRDPLLSVACLQVGLSLRWA